MLLGDLLDRSVALEERAQRLYARFAAGASDAALAGFWAQLAAEETGHAEAVRSARAQLSFSAARRTRVDGWAEALAEIEGRLAAAEALGADAGLDAQLSAALALEGSEIDAMRQAATAVAAGVPPAAEAAHVRELAAAALRLSADPHVQLEATRLLAQAHVMGR
ncbi:MAG: hypothetical protein KIT14_11860 [bacterium]|nr:hypothetical protein [bacterium]